MTTLDTLKVFLDGDSSKFNRALEQASQAVDKHKKRLAAMAAIDDKLGKGAARVAERVIAAQQRQEAAVKRAADRATREAERFAAAEKRKADAAARAAERIEKAKAREAAKGGGLGGMAGMVKGALHLGAMSYVLHQVSDALGAFYKLAEEGARTAAAQKYFENTGKSIADFREATHGLVSDADLIKKANLADTMGISGESFKQLAQVAHAAAAKTGQSFKHMLDSIVLGTARESRLLLDNLGIIVDVKKAKLDYARALKEADKEGQYANLTIQQLAASLSDAAEKEAFMAAAMKSGNPALQEQGKVGATAADNFDRLSAAFDNVLTAAGKLFAEGSTSLVANMASALQLVAAQLEAIGKFGFSAEGGMGGFLKALGGVVKEHPWLLALGGAGVQIAGVMAAGTAPAEREADLTEKWTEAAGEVYRLFGDPIDAMAIFENGLETQAAIFRNLSQEQINAIYRFKELEDVLKKLATAPKKGATGPKVDADKLKAANEKVAKEAAKANEKEWEKTDKWFEDYFKKQEEAEKAKLKLSKEAMDYAKEWADKFHKTVTDGPNSKEEADKEAKAKADAAEAAAEEAARKEAAAAGKVNQVTGLIGALKGGEAQGIGQAIGGFFGPLGEAVGSLIGELVEGLEPVMSLLGHVAQGVSALLKLALEPLLSALTPLGPALELFLGAVGVLIGAALKPLIPILQLVVTALVWLFNGISWLLIVINPFVELLATVLYGLLGIFVLWDDGISDMLRTAELFTYTMALGAVKINNTIVRIMRGLGQWLQDTIGNDFGLMRAGRELVMSDLLAPVNGPIDDNTDATLDNTRATRDLAQELRNLPQGYKINYALYNATAPVGPVWRPGAGALTGRGLNSGGLNNSNFRRRT